MPSKQFIKMIYTKYDPATGQIIQTLSISDNDSIAANLPTEHYVEGYYDGDKHYIDIATKTAIQKGDKPYPLANWDYTSKQWLIDSTTIISQIRNIRNDLLSQIDRVNPVWYSTLTADQQNQLIAYRQALLDVPQQSGFPATIEWPTKPTWL